MIQEPSQCVICLECFNDEARDEGFQCPNSHYICKDDLTQFLSENALSQVFKLKESMGSILCPVPGCKSQLNIVGLFNRMQKREQTRYLSILSGILVSHPRLQRLREALLDVITLKCPTCQTTIDPLPDACSAVMCLSCGNHYCNYCFQAFATGDREGDRAAAHTHCATHSTAEDPLLRDAFLSAERVAVGQREFQIMRLVKFLALAMSSDEYGSNGRHAVEIILVAVKSELDDLHIDIVQVWDGADRRLRGDAQHTATASSNTTAAAPRSADTAVVVDPRQRGTLLLWNAIISDNAEAIAQILTAYENNFDPHYVDPASGMAIFFLAVVCRRVDVAILLLEAGADPWSCDRNGRSAMYVIAEIGQVEVLPCIHRLWPNLDWNAPSTREVSRSPMLIIAARYNQGAFIKSLLSLLPPSRIDLERKEDEFGYTALHMTAIRGSDWVLKILLDAGANHFCRCTSQRYPLYAVVELGYTECLRLLAAKDPTIISSVLDPETQYRPLHVALLYNQLETANLLLDLGADVNVAPDTIGYCTPLMMGILKTQGAVVVRMLDRGADFRIPNVDGRLPIYVVVEMNMETVLRKMIEKGLDVNAPATSEDNVTYNLLHIAVKFGHSNMVQLLIQHGADVNAVDDTSFYDSVVDVAVKLGDEASLRALLNAGARYRYTVYSPLYYAIERGHVSITRLLIEHFTMRPNCVVITSDLRFSALHVAAYFNQDKVAFLLLQLGWTTLIQAMDQSGKTPLQIAVERQAHAAAAVIRSF